MSSSDYTDPFSGGDIDVGHALAHDPPPLDFVLPGFLAATVGILIGSGGVGKSWLALQLALAVASSGSADLLSMSALAGGRVLYVGLEDTKGILLHRLRALGLRLSQDQHERVRESLHTKSLTGRLIDLIDSRCRDALTKHAEGMRLLIIDTLSRAHQADENSNGDMARLLNALERICARAGCAVLLVHHMRKGGAGETGPAQHAARGASVLVDNARWGISLDRMSESESETLADVEYSPDPLLPLPVHARRGFYCRLSTSKINYGEPQEDRWFRREKGGVLVPARLEYRPSIAKSGGGGKASARAEKVWRGRPE